VHLRALRCLAPPDDSGLASPPKHIEGILDGLGTVWAGPVNLHGDRFRPRTVLLDVPVGVELLHGLADLLTETEEESAIDSAVLFVDISLHSKHAQQTTWQNISHA